MRKRITEAQLREWEELAAIEGDAFFFEDSRRLLAEVRRLRDLIAPLADPTPEPPSRYNNLLAEARAIREEQDRP